MYGCKTKEVFSNNFVLRCVRDEPNDFYAEVTERVSMTLVVKAVDDGNELTIEFVRKLRITRDIDELEEVTRLLLS